MAKRQEYGMALNWGYVGTSVVVITVLTLLILYMPGMREIDANILHSIRLALAPYPTYVPNFVSEFYPCVHFYWPQIAAGSVLVSHQKYLKCFLLIFFTKATSVLTLLLKDFVCRERPHGCGYEGFSFPSHHCAVTMCFYGILIYLVMRYVSSEFWRYFLIGLFGLIIAIIAISRMWFGVHFLSDVIAGLFLGFMMVNLYIILSKALSK